MSKEHAYAYEAGYRDGAINYELDHCPACKNIADLQEALEENAKLRDELAKWERLAAGIVLPEYPVTQFKPKDLERENAKLREQTELLVTLLRNDCDIEASWDGLRKFWYIGLTESGCLMRDRACKAEAENAKLRELLQRTWDAFHDATAREFVTVKNELRELGVEADG